MKKNKPGIITTKTYSITVPKTLLPEIMRMAAESGRTVSGYLSYLIRENTGQWRK
jgi:hypothetical protein